MPEGQLKEHVCSIDGCYRSFDTERGKERHEKRGNHDPSADQ